MKISMEDKKKEAIKRMHALDIYAEAIRHFEYDGTLNYSEPPLGMNYWLSDEQKEIVKKFEEEHDALVYFVIRSYTNIGTLDSLLFVSDYIEDWTLDNYGIKDGDVYAYVHNYDYPECSEMGCIGVQAMYGGLIIIW